MKRIISLITVLMLTVAAMAQTLNITVGDVTFRYPASLTGEMTYGNGASTLTVLGKIFTLADISSMTVDSLYAVDESICVNLPGKGRTLELGWPSEHPCEILIPEEAQSWIRVKWAIDHKIGLYLDTNTDSERTATITVKYVDVNDTTFLRYKITQAVYEIPEIPYNEIRYITKDNKMIDLNNNPFNSPVISHTYENGKGIIRCTEDITTINDNAFNNIAGGFHTITNISLPNSITTLRSGALRYLNIKSLRLPDKLSQVHGLALNIPMLECFTGKNVTADGRGVLLENIDPSTNQKNQVFVALAPAGLSSYTLPSEVGAIAYGAFVDSPELREIVFNEGLKTIGMDAFDGCRLDCKIVFPASLEKIEEYAFIRCEGIHGFYGNERFHTPDHLCLIANLAKQNPVYGLPGPWIIKYVGKNEDHYVIPEGIIGVGYEAFAYNNYLNSVTLPSSILYFNPSSFYRCKNLEAVYGDCTSDDHKAIIFGKQFHCLVVKKGVTHYVVPDGITSIGACAFEDSWDLEEVIVPDNVTELGEYAFFGCPKLKKVVLSANLKRVNGYNPFLSSINIKEIYFRSNIPPTYSDTQFYEEHCKNLTVYVPEGSLELYKKSGWYQYAPYMVEYKYDDLEE